MTDKWINNLWQGCTNFPKIVDPSQNPRHEKRNMTQVTCWIPKHIRHHRTNCCRYGDHARPICAPLAYGALLERCEKTDVSEKKKTCRSDTLLSEIPHWLAWDRTRIIAMRRMQRFSNEVRWHVVSAVRCALWLLFMWWSFYGGRRKELSHTELGIVTRPCSEFVCAIPDVGWFMRLLTRRIWGVHLLTVGCHFEVKRNLKKFCQSNMRDVYE